MTESPGNLLPMDVLLELLPAAFEPWGSMESFSALPPTRGSVQRIESELGLAIPKLLIEIAQACGTYGGWFGSLGEDVASQSHIITINRTFRAHGVPPRYVLLNHGHDGDCDAWDTFATRPPGNELPIVYFRFSSESKEIRCLRTVASTFAQYIDGFVRSTAPRCPVKALRRGAKRILKGYEPMSGK